jgi:multiple sugar transport system permease protein
MTAVLAGAASSRRLAVGRRLSRRLMLVVVIAILAAGGVLFVVPFIWMLSTSVKPIDQVYLLPPVWVPRVFEWKWYGGTWARYDFPLFYRNTIVVCALNQIGMFFSCSMVAFSFARLRFPGRNLLFLVLLSTMMLPGQVTLIPTYLFFTKLRWVNTLRPLIVPNYLAISAFTVFLMRQYFMTIPLEMDDAARVDGVSIPGLYWRIIVPLSKPVLGVAAIIQFTYDWNDFFNPLIYLNSQQRFTVAIALNMLHSNITRYDIQAVMAMTVVSILPLLVLFFVAQRYFIQGIVVTGVKG